MYKKSPLKISLLCVVSILGNIVFSYLAGLARLPCFLDTIFSVAITFYAGLIPGLIVAGLFNPIMMLVLCYTKSVPLSFYDTLYALCGMLIVLSTWFFSHNKKEFLYSHSITALYLTLIVFTSSFLSCIAASLLDTFILPHFNFISGFSLFDSFHEVLRQFEIGPFLSYLIPRIPLTFLDRLFCTVTGFFIYLLMERYDRKHFVD